MLITSEVLCIVPFVILFHTIKNYDYLSLALGVVIATLLQAIDSLYRLSQNNLSQSNVY